MLRKWFALMIAIITIIPLTASAESVDMDGNHNEFQGRFGVVRKENTGSTCSLILIKGNGFAAWASKLFFWPPPTQEQKRLREKYPFYTYERVLTCSKKNYEDVPVGSLIDIGGILEEGRIDRGKLIEIRKNLGPMIYNPDGLIHWLYRDLSEK